MITPILRAASGTLGVLSGHIQTILVVAVHKNIIVLSTFPWLSFSFQLLLSLWHNVLSFFSPAKRDVFLLEDRTRRSR